MQSASDNLARAVTGDEVLWTKSTLMADWARDGYGDPGSIDDLSEQYGPPITVVHALDDGLPNGVSFVRSSAPSKLSAPLVWGRGGQLPAEYYSAFNDASPLSGYDRDVAPVTLDVGPVTDDGPEQLRIFTGQMINLPVRRGRATLNAISAARLALSTLVQPPPIAGIDAGCNATWPISWTLAQAGIHTSPPPRAGCRLWMPMHGSLQPMIPHTGELPVGDQSAFGAVDITGAGLDLTFTPIRPVFTDDAPYLLAVDCSVTAAVVRTAGGRTLGLAAGADLLSRAGNAGRVEFWIRGDSANINTAPGGSGLEAYTDGAASFVMVQATTGSVRCGINWARQAYITVDDGSGPATATGPSLPTDSGWHFVGIAWNVAANKVWLRVDSTTTTSTSLGLATTALQGVDDVGFESLYPMVNLFLPVAELHVTSGADADPDTVPWLNEVAFEPGAVVLPSEIELEALAETAPREGWEYIGSYAQAELAAMRTDETDRVLYLPPRWWALAEQQTVVDALSTVDNAMAPDIDIDPTKIRNSVRVDYTDTRIADYATHGTVYSPALSRTERATLTAGTTDITYPLDKPITRIQPLFELLDGAGVDAYSDDPPTYDDDTFVTINEHPEGEGAYATTADVEVTVLAWHPGAVTIRFVVYTGTWYLANDGAGVPVLRVAGRVVGRTNASVVVTNPESIATRGARTLVVSLPIVQTRDDATAIAHRILDELANPVAVIEDIQVFGDPRRQPGDLVTVADPVATRAGGVWRSLAVTHAIDGPDYRQTLLLRQARLLGVWGESRWGLSLWGDT